MINTTIATITQIAFLLVALAGFVFVLAQADGADRPIARYRATTMLICSLSAGFGLLLPALFQKWEFGPTTIWTSSSIGLSIILLANVGLVAWISRDLLTKNGRDKIDHWTWQFLLTSNVVLILCLFIVLVLQLSDGFSVSLSVITVVFFSAAIWQILVSIFLFRQVIVERV
jgi:hypothetical protein